MVYDLWYFSQMPEVFVLKRLREDEGGFASMAAERTINHVARGVDLDALDEDAASLVVDHPALGA